MKKDAKISACGVYRYALWRIWDESKPTVLFIGLNPSTADASEDDPTIRKCIAYAKLWNFGGLCMANLFAYRSPKTSEMLSAKDPIGPENDRWVKKLAEDADLIVAAWGNLGSYQGRSGQMSKMIPNLHYLKINKTGEPSHPLYLPKNLFTKPLA